MDQTCANESHSRTCQKSIEHAGMPVAMICLQKQCSLKRMCCCACVDDSHCRHELISLSKFERYLTETLNHNIIIENKEEIIGILKRGRESFQQQIEALKNHFILTMTEITSAMDQHFDSIQGSLIQLKAHNISSQNFSEEKIQEYLCLSKEIEKNLVKSIDDIVQSVNNTNGYLKDKLAAYDLEINKQSACLIKVIENFQIAGTRGFKTFAFGAQIKSASLSLSNNNKTVKRVDGAGGYPIAVVESPFTELNNEINFLVKEQPGNKGVWMGVCLINIVKSNSFQSCYGLGKGTWAIDQVGQNHTSAFSWSHHDANYNSSPSVGFQYSIGDVINIKIDFAHSRVVFTKNALTYEQPIRLDLGPIHAFAGPAHPGDVIQII